MKVAKIIARNRKQLNVRFECEHCGLIFIGTGRDNEYFHSVVVPSMSCGQCGKTAGPGFVPMKPEDRWPEEGNIDGS